MGVGKKDDELNHQRKKKTSKICLKKRDQCIKLKRQTFNCKAFEQRKHCVCCLWLCLHASRPSRIISGFGYMLKGWGNGDAGREGAMWK